MSDTLASQLEKASPAAAPDTVLSAAAANASAAAAGHSPSSACLPRPYRFSSSPTLTLSLTAGYAPHWTKREGVRELVQNWYDGCNANLRSLNQHIAATTAPAPYTLSIGRTSAASHALYQATASHVSRPPLHLGSILHHSPSATLTFHNNAVSLTRAILLLGHTSKRATPGPVAADSGAHAEGMVGSFGEGMKVGMLALLREGCRCWMGTRGELWRFDFYHDHNYGETLLGVWTADSISHAAAEQHDKQETEGEDEEAREVWDALSAQQRHERVVLRAMLDQRKATDTTTVLAGIATDDWTAYQHDFLFLSSTAPASVVSTPLGSILLSSAHQHCLFVKGFLVASFPHELVYGVNLSDAKLDRDRKAVLQTSELHRVVGSMWAQAVSARPELMDKYFELLLHHSSSAEAKNAEYYLTSHIVENVASTFFALHGHDSQPVLNSSGDDAVFISTQLSRRPVLVPAALYEILTRSARIQPVEQLIAQQQSRGAPQLALSSLSPQQLHCLHSAVRLVQLLSPLFTVEDVAVTSLAHTDDEVVWCREEDTAAGGSAAMAGRAGRVLLDSRCLDIDAVHERWGDCGLEDRRVQQGRGKGHKGLVAMSECSCREAAIAALIVKETRRVRWRHGAAALVAAAAAGRGERKRGGDAIMEHIARGRESELLMVNLLERTVRRAETERGRRESLEHEKQVVLEHLQHSADSSATQRQQQPAPPHDEHKQQEPATSDSDWVGGSELAVAAESQQQRGVQHLSLQHDVELLRADLQRQQQLAAQHSVDWHTRERLLRASIAQLSGQSQSLDGLPDARLTELERTHLAALTHLQAERDERRRRAAEAEDERRKRSECGVCMSRAIDCVLLPCRHASVCYECARQVNKCGVCRQAIDECIQFFG